MRREPRRKASGNGTWPCVRYLPVSLTGRKETVSGTTNFPTGIRAERPVAAVALPKDRGGSVRPEGILPTVSLFETSAGSENLNPSRFRECLRKKAKFFGNLKELKPGSLRCKETNHETGTFSSPRNG